MFSSKCSASLHPAYAAQRYNTGHCLSASSNSAVCLQPCFYEFASSFLFKSSTIRQNTKIKSRERIAIDCRTQSIRNSVYFQANATLHWSRLRGLSDKIRIYCWMQPCFQLKRTPFTVSVMVNKTSFVLFLRSYTIDLLDDLSNFFPSKLDLIVRTLFS